MKHGLLLVDIQNDYFPGGRWELEGIEEAAAVARSVLDGFREQMLPVFHVQHVFQTPDPPFFAPETEGAELHASVAPLEHEDVLVKAHPNAFRRTNLLARLEADDIDELVVCGAMSHMCVEATVRAADDFGLRCTVVHDACATRAVEFGGRTVAAADVHATAMAALAFGYARLATGRELLRRL